nr:hypothetical protein [Tanacetum cinerariifolium]
DEDQLWTYTQNLMHAPIEWKLYDRCGVHQVTSKDKEIFMLVEKDYPVRKGLAIVMICYKLQVENYSQMANDLILKIYNIANCPSQQDVKSKTTEDIISNRSFMEVLVSNHYVLVKNVLGWKGLTEGKVLSLKNFGLTFIFKRTYELTNFMLTLQKLDEEVDELKTHLHIIPNDEDDVYTEATPLALKVLVVDYQIHIEHNKPYYKIIGADGTHQLFLSFISLLRNFDREDLEMLWQIVQERFASLEPKNFSDDFLLNTLKTMFEKPNV